ncbi:MAG: chemotaxis protein CheW [Pseudoxanthomonas suwonensis]|nr:chemotaxis protein CheW [Pseudoxanthomonas suwonensis]
MDAHPTDIRGVLIQAEKARLLLPNASIAEVLSFATPEPVDGAPGWLLGRIRWRGWQLPLVAFTRMAGLSEETGEPGNRVLVLKALGGNPAFPYFAIVTQGYPRLVTVSEDALQPLDDGDDGLPDGVFAKVQLRDDEALVPDLVAAEAIIQRGLAEADAVPTV